MTGNENDPFPANNTASDNFCRLSISKEVLDLNGDGRIDSNDVYQDAGSGRHKITYTVTVANPQAGNNTSYTLTDLPRFANLVTVRGASVTSSRAGYGTATYTGPGPYDLGSGNGTTSTVSIARGVTHTYTVDVIYDGPVGNPAISPYAECVSGTEGRGLFNRATLVSNAVTTDATACGPVSRPQDVTMTLLKTAANGDTTPLTGAGFALHEVGADDGVGAWVKDMGETGAGFYSAVLTPGKAYYLVETRSPTGYQLLSQPVLLYVDRDAGGNATLVILNESSNVAAVVTDSGTNRDTVVMTLADVRIGELPKSGGGGVGAWALAGGGLLLLALLAVALPAISRRVA